MTSGSAKRARMEETSLAAPVQATPTIDIPSDAEPAAPRALPGSPPTGVPIPEVRPVEAPAAGRRRKSVARRPSSHRATADESIYSEGGSENPFNDKALIRRLLDGCILSDVVERIDRADPEQRAWDTLGSFLEIGHQLFAYVEASGRMRRDLLRAEERCQDEVARLQAKTAEVAALREALERERQDREEERRAQEEERRSLEESARKAEAEVAHLTEQTPVLVSEARTLADMLQKKEELEKMVETLRQSWSGDGGDHPMLEGAGPP
uniref:Ensconsin-like n=1 Tax=Elaeis guineensis var. tenera TaxID=51953 RepID=A0A8N4EP97_ELAGV|nr:ensconsin-like [Elaeis guineensis]